MLTYGIIQAEHRSILQVICTMSAVSHDLSTQSPALLKVELRTIRLMLQYIDNFADRLHHAKENAPLFKKLWERSEESHLHLKLLRQQYQDGSRYLEHLQQQMINAGNVESNAVASLKGSILQFCGHLKDRIRIEETIVMPMARTALLQTDWDEVDAAFVDSDDPPFGSNVGSQMVELGSRIAMLASEPVGLAGTVEPPAEQPRTVPHVPASKTSEFIMEISGLTSHYSRIQALHGIDLQVREGQLVALVGANGAGKTTTLRTISGVQSASGGVIRFVGKDITRLRADLRVRHGICQVPEGRRVFGPLSVEDNIRLGAYTQSKRDAASMLDRMFELFPVLKEKRSLPAGTLSGGQQQMLAMARALMGKPKLLLLDEPSMGLAPLLVDEIFRVVKELKSQGITIVLVEQNAHAALAIADVGYVLETGRVLLSGPGPELLQNDQVKKAYLGI